MGSKRIPGAIGQALPVYPQTPPVYPQTSQTGALGLEVLPVSSSTAQSPDGAAQRNGAETGAWNGSAAVVGTGIAAIARIPVPGTNGLHIELKPRGWTPSGGTTSSVFIQDITGKRVLRLDYGFNKATGKMDYHWNQKGTFSEFGIADHAAPGRAGPALYEGAKYFRYAGRVLLVLGLAIDVYSIVVAKRRWRQVARVTAGWAGATAGCEFAGAWGAGAGTAAEPGGGTAAGGLLGCVVGGIAGYAGAAWAAGEIYDWVEEEYFASLTPTSAAEQ